MPNDKTLNYNVLKLSLALATLFHFNIWTNAQVLYKEVVIGSQVWMVRNLNVDKFRNGDPIPQAKNMEEWKNAGNKKQPAWCYYNNDPSNGVKYGKLYNWYAVIDPRGLSPKGWHIPSYEEWAILSNFVGEGKSSVKLKSASDWNHNGNGTNSTGFSALPGGWLDAKQERFNAIGNTGYWWSSSNNGNFEGWCKYLSYSQGFSYTAEYYKENGFSVRCIKD